MKVVREQQKLTDFISKYNISTFNEKTNFLVCLFSVFFRLQIYEAIAAIFWQSASYVCNFKTYFLNLFEVELE